LFSIHPSERNTGFAGIFVGKIAKMHWRFPGGVVDELEALNLTREFTSQSGALPVV
jgi:hypothetical protein